MTALRTRGAVGRTHVELDEAGDTLIEILIAIVVIALTVTALMGALLTTLTSSSEHRSLSALDTVLGSFSQTVQAEVQGKPQASGSSNNPLFVNCPTQSGSLTSPYQVISAPSPDAGPVATASILFLSGWAPGTLTVKLGPTYASGTTATITSGSQVPASGNVTVTFTVPGTLGSGAQAVWVHDPAESAASQTEEAPTDFVVTAGATNAPSLAGYSVDISGVQQWNPSTGKFATPNPCISSGMQLITATGVSSNGVSASISFIVTGAAVTTVTVSLPASGVTPPNPANPKLGNTLTFLAQILPPNSTTTAPTGTVTWNFSGSPDSPPGSTTSAVCSNGGNTTTTAVSTLNGATTATCTVQDVAAGPWTVSAQYNGDQNYPSTPSEPYQVSVAKDSVTVNVTSSPTQPVPGNAFTFTATITPATNGDPDPTGTVLWTFSSPTAPAPVCSNEVQNQAQNTTAVNTTGGTTVATCAINSPVAGNYSVVAQYSGDSNFLTPPGAPSTTNVSKATATLMVTSSPTSPTTGSTLLFTATFSWPNGDPTPTGNVTWSWAGSVTTPTCLGGDTTTVTTIGFTGQTTTTCTLDPPLQQGKYVATATYNGNADYNTSSGSDSVTVTLQPAGLNIQGVPNPQDGKPDSGDAVVYTFNQAMSSQSIMAGWTGAKVAVYAQFAKVNGQTQLQICGTSTCNPFGAQVNLGTVSLDDGGKYLGSGFNPSITLSANMTMNAADTVVTITLTSSSTNMVALNPTTLTTTLTWTPSGNATSTSLVPCSTTAVPENNGANPPVTTPEANF